MAKCAYKKDGIRCDKKPLSGSKYCRWHSPIVLGIIKWLKGTAGFATVLIGVLASLAALGMYVPLFSKTPLQISSDYELSPEYIPWLIRVPTGTSPTDYLERSYSDFNIDFLDALKQQVQFAFLAKNTVIASIDLTSKSTLEWLKIDPKVLVKIDEIETNNITPDVVIVTGHGCGGGGFAWKFPVNIRDVDLKKGNITYSEGIIDTYRDYPADFVTLEPGEHEVFSAYIVFPQPGLYKFSLGIEYLFNGKKIQQWTQNSFSVDIPSDYRSYEWENVLCSRTTMPPNPILVEKSCSFKVNEYVCEEVKNSKP